ncbi:MAG: hypothetical protein ACXVRV_05695 [Gaiellaceae bacterium]
MQAQAGAVSFSDLVRAHFRRELARAHPDDGDVDACEREFCERLKEFERKEGSLAAVYWSTHDASAVALTMGHPQAGRNPLVDTEMVVRLHRVTDWVTRHADAIADVLHDCDLLAIRVSEILRGTSERIAMRWLYAVQEHLLGFIERTDQPDDKAQREVVSAQRRELARIEQYYLRAGAKAGRIVYVSGMLLGATVIATVCAVLAYFLTRHTHTWNRDVQVLLLCTGAGAVGALVSVLSRMSGGSDKFTVDFEVGRPLIRRLGLYKPLVGSVFGVALYFLLVSGLLMTQPPQGKTIYFYGVVAFLAGFSERFTGVIFGGAESLISGETDTSQETEATPASKPATTATPTQ